MENMPILSVKLKMPQPRKNYIVRHHLYERLRNLFDYKVTIIKAGAGCGKTTLFSSFAIESELEHVRWITLDENANQSFVFWNYVIEAVKDYIEDTKADFQTFFDSNMQKENLWQILSLFVNKLNINHDIVLVLDDFQVITDEFLISTINFFLENMPECVHLVLLTRELPEIYLGALAIEDQLLIFDEDTIRMNDKESREFLLQTLKLHKEEDEIHSMIEASEGWIGGLQLLAMAAKDRTFQMTGNLKASHRVLNDYITKEIFEYLTEEEQEFLVETSILRYFNQAICNQYQPELDFNAMMESILQKNLFVINIDEAEGIYRYHAILVEYLKGLYDKMEDTKKKEWHNLAAKIYQDMGDYEESLYHLFCVQEYEKIMELILKMPQTALTFSYLIKVPMEEISKNTDFAYQYFFYYYASVDEEACEKIYNYIKLHMKDDKTFEAFKRSNMFYNDKWEFNSANILSIKQISELPLNSVTTAFLLIKEAYFLYAASNYQEALKYLDCAEEVYRKTGNIYIGFFAISEKAQIYEDMGELLEALNLYQQMQTMIDQVKSLASSYYIGIAGVYIRQLLLDKTYEVLEQARESLKDDSNNSIERAFQYNLAEYYYLIGDDQKTEQLIKEVLGTDQLQNIYYSARILRYPIYRGNHKELAIAFARGYEADKNKVMNNDCELLYANILYEDGDKNKAIKLIDDMIANARKTQNKLKIVEGDLLKTRILLDNAGDQKEIKNLFIEAISYAAVNRIAHPFWFERATTERIGTIMKEELKEELSVDEYEFLELVLHVDLKHGIRVEGGMLDNNTLDGSLQNQQLLTNDRNSSNAVLDQLTEREKDVLNEMALGNTNMQIAENLCVSLATVKTHINNIYSKLGVNNRIAAINKVKDNY
ncbi:LuxR C-terminal-related transcriptional regulator [Anaeromicropila herbilytica]|uniref:Helix-turn-helix transcriptional regulator n=1 Tax=Anaeromicropila herbilytica TaxID=2785025 RepID=A0A7R7ICR3_9FIRM|nr:LuxR C-terminal-related transcriptional regulator [Anaeromicropila herbilytica]BCN31023.1 helix-turn-helix transcriptional regulator [Anaeromicropila herbilytica]